MKGTDGVAERVPFSTRSSLDDVVLLAAPGVGFYIRIFKIQGTNSGTNLVMLRDSVPTNLWYCAAQALRPFYDYDPCGVIAFPENEPVILENVGLITVILNLTYEIRPIED